MTLSIREKTVTVLVFVICLALFLWAAWPTSKPSGTEKQTEQDAAQRNKAISLCQRTIRQRYGADVIFDEDAETLNSMGIWAPHGKVGIPIRDNEINTRTYTCSVTNDTVIEYHLGTAE